MVFIRILEPKNTFTFIKHTVLVSNLRAVSQDQNNLFSGTSVATGKARGTVIDTGLNFIALTNASGALQVYFYRLNFWP